MDRAKAADDRREAALDRLRAAAERAEALRVLSTAQLDDLTGTYRRVVGEHALQVEIQRARVTGSRLVLAILDVDGLKEVNDRYGHLAGDQLLRDVVASVQSHVRSHEPIVRLGGDEFAFTIAGLDLEGAVVRVEMIRDELTRRPSHGEISVGLAEVRPEDALEDAVARADTELLQAS